MRYRTIVADPPWEIGDFPPNFGYAAGKRCPYPTLTVDEIAALPVMAFSDNRGQDAHLYLWTIDQYLESAFSIVRAWGFRHSATLTWCKQTHGVGLGGTFPSNTEFVLFCRRPAYVDRHGSLVVTRWLRDEIKKAGVSRRRLMDRGDYTEGQLVHWLAGTEAVGPSVPSVIEWQRLRTLVGFDGSMDRLVEEINAKKGTRNSGPLVRAPGRWFTWPRSQHSTKPEAFLDLVEQVSPGPYLELFARRQRLGWDTWGDEALNHVELSA